jgi:hypothetical protein
MIKHLKPKSDEEIESYWSKHPSERFQYAIENDDLKQFINCVNRGIKLTANNIKYTDPILWPWKPDRINLNNESLNIVQYIKNNLDSNIKMSNKTKQILKMAINATNSKRHYKGYPNEYKQWRILKMIHDSDGVFKDEITKIFFELGYGPNTYNPLAKHSYRSNKIKLLIYLYVYKEKNKYFLTKNGEEKLKLLDEHFKNTKINAYI